MLKNPALFQNGFHLTYFAAPERLRELVRGQQWEELDQEMKTLTAKDGRLYQLLQTYHDFTSIEFIISVRDASSGWEDDGIWHDDGSRVFAFSLSLTENSDQLRGGRLGIRPMGEEQCLEIPTPSFGGIIMFLTGVYGFEHRIHKVAQGRRIIIAGWCT